MAEHIEKYDAYKIISDFQYERLKDGKTHISLSELGKITLCMSVLPTIDIVTCRECIHNASYNMHNDNLRWLCKGYEDNDFCSRGER